MKLTLTPEQKAKYLKHSYHCPNCGTDQIEGGDIDMDNGQMWQNIHCLECDGEWTDIYSLTDIESQGE